MVENQPEITTHREVQDILAQASDPMKAAHSLRFFKTGPGEYGEGDVFRGIRVPVLRQVAAQAKRLPLSEVLLLLKSAYHEDRLSALFMLVRLFKTSNEERREEIVNAYLAHSAYVNGWDLVDSSAHLILGQYLTSRNRAILFELAESPMLWERRIAMIATYWFIKQKDFRDSLLIAHILLRDKEDLIQKAVGWMLREIGNRDHDAEIGFLNEHYQEMPRTMLRYAIEKFPEPLRLAYLKGTV